MDLPNLLNKITSNQTQPEQFVAIEIGLDTVKVAIWQSDGKHTEVSSIGSTQAFDLSVADELLSAIDTSLADAQAVPVPELDKVIFGLPDSWVVNDRIVDDRKPILKTICHRFNFHPIGFVVTTVAITHYLRDVEGGPPSAILVQTGANQIAVSLISQGQLESTQIVERSTNLTTDIEEAIGKIAYAGNLPSRIIYLIGQEDPEPIKQELISYDWQKKLSFLHLPQVETLPKEWSIKAIAISGGAEVIQLSPPPAKAKPVATPPPASILGFKPVNLSQTPTPTVDSIVDKADDNLESANLSSPSPPSFFRRLTSAITLPSFRFPSQPKLIVLPIVVAVLLVGLSLGALWAYRRFPQADININLAMSAFQQQITFTIDPNVSVSDLSTNLISGTKTTADVSGSKTITTTGTKLIGDRAKGKIVIYNRTNTARTLKAGTTISANKLKFSLDTGVTIASASSRENADFSVTIEPTKTTAVVTATDIGSAYNLAKDTQFSIDNFSTDTLFGLAEADFTGGSSKTVSAVALADQTAVKTELIKELQDQLGLQGSSESSVPVGQVSVGQPKINQEDYSASKNEEASELTLNLGLSQEIYQYDPGELTVIAQTTAAKSLPENTQIRPDNTKVNILSSQINDLGQAIITAQIILYYIPRIDGQEIASSMINTPLDQVESKLSGLAGYQQSQITHSQYLVLKRLPPTPSQISVRIVPVSVDTENP